MAPSLISVVCFILCASFHGHIGSDAVRLSITPDKLIATTEESVEISCVADRTDVNGEITVIEVYRNDEAPVAVLRHCSEITYGTQTSSLFQAVGTIDKEMGNSFLNLTLSNPTSGDTGIYTCVVYYLDPDGVMKDQKASQNMVVENLDVKVLETVLNTMKNKISLLEGRQTETHEIVSLNQQEMTDWATRLENTVNFTTAFSATNSKSTITTTAGKIIILPDIIMRYGEGYDEKTGIFTSPREGLYVFHVVVTDSRPAHAIHMNLRKNEEVIARLYAYDKVSWSQSGMSSVVNLKPGDKVFSVMRSGSTYLRHNLYTVFTGYLVHPF